MTGRHSLVTVSVLRSGSAFWPMRICNDHGARLPSLPACDSGHHRVSRPSPAPGLTAAWRPSSTDPAGVAWRRIGVFGGTFDPAARRSPGHGRERPARPRPRRGAPRRGQRPVAEEPQGGHPGRRPPGDGRGRRRRRRRPRGERPRAAPGRALATPPTPSLSCGPTHPGAELFLCSAPTPPPGCRRGSGPTRCGPLASIVVVTRPGSEEGRPPPGWDWAGGRDAAPRGVEHRPPRPGSPTAGPLDYLLTTAVLDCIEARGLYRSRRMNWRRAWRSWRLEVVLLLGHPVRSRWPGSGPCSTPPTVAPSIPSSTRTSPATRRSSSRRRPRSLLGTDGPTLTWVALAVPRRRGRARGRAAARARPTRTRRPTSASANATLAEVYAEPTGWPPSRRPPPACSGTGVGEVVTVEPERLAALVAPVTPLAVANPDDVDGFDAGDARARRPSASSRYLAATEPGESDLARLARHEAVLAGVVRRGGRRRPTPTSCPGRPRPGVGRFVRGLAAGPRSGRGHPRGGATPTGPSVVDPAAVADLVEDRVPFPVAAVARCPAPGPGARRRRCRRARRAGGRARSCGRAARSPSSATPTGSGPRRRPIVYYDAALHDRRRRRSPTRSASDRRSAAPDRTPTTSST